MHALDLALEAIRQQFAAAEMRTSQQARVDITRQLQQYVRKVQQYQSEQNWTDAVLDGSSQFAAAAAVFVIKNGTIQLAGQRNLVLEENHSFTIASAAAFLGVIKTKDPLTALPSERELTLPLASAISSSRVYLLPVINDDHVVAVLLATTDDTSNLDALELITTIASMALQRRSNVKLHTQIAVSAAAPTLPSPQGPLESPASPAHLWARLPQQERTLHLRAQRFARIKVAEMQLAKPEAARAGRSQSNYYVFLKPEIDGAREQFRKQFMVTPSMVDYLHLELVRVGVDGDELKMGADYPGHLE